jgi:CelD/BcsL family acetyltransferase involved in cellulose biosynthesis
MTASSREAVRPLEATSTSPPALDDGNLSPEYEATSFDPVTFSVARGRRGFESIRREWQDLVDRRREHSPLAHAPQWYDAYLNTSPNRERVYFFVARQGSALVAIFPFERRTLFVLGVPLPAWVLPYHDHMPFSDVIAASAALPALIPALLRAMSREGKWALVIARNVLAESAAAALAANPSFAHRLERPRGDCHYLDCGQPYDQLLASFSRKHRANLRRHRNNLSALGTLETTRETEVESMQRCFGEFLAVECSGWKGSAGEGTAIALHPELERYYRHLIRTFGDRGECELNILRLNGRCIAAQFCVTVGGAWYLLKIGYDEQYAKYSPGSLLQEEALVRLCADPAVTTANLASDAAWHLNWNPGSLAMADHYLGTSGAVGVIAISLVRSRARLVRELRGLRERLTARWRGRSAGVSRHAAAEA